MFFSKVLGIDQQVAETKNRVQWSSEFVRHFRQKVAFQLVGFKQRQVCMRQLIHFSIKVGVHLF